MSDATPTPGFAILGDLMLGRHVGPLIEEQGLESLLSDVRAASGTRALVANLESPLWDGSPGAGSGGPRFAAPVRRAGELRASGIVAVSLANNHILDCGDDGLRATLEALDDAGIVHTGAGRSRTEATAPAVFTVGGRRVGILGFTYIHAASDAGPGVASLYDSTVEEAIARVRPTVDFLVAMPHAGIELFQYPLPRDQRRYRRMIDLGADIVAGSHPHCVQAMETYGGRPIYYGVGDCLFDHYRDDVWQRFWSDRAHPKRYGLSVPRDLPKVSLMLTVDVANGGWSIGHVPFKLDPGPRRLVSAEREAWAEAFAALGAKLQSDDAVTRQRSAIEEDLLASLRKRGEG